MATHGGLHERDEVVDFVEYEDYEERDPLLNGDDLYSHVTNNDNEPYQPDPHASLPVYTNIHMVRREVIDHIDDPYSLEQLRAPRMNALMVRPMVDRLYALNDISIVYCLLVNRVQFLREQTHHAHHQTVNITRALLCEILANRVLRKFDEDNPGHAGLLLLANILVAGFEPFQNAPEDVLREEGLMPAGTGQKRAGYERKSTALELAIISESKNLLSTSTCQKLVDAVYDGRVVYTPVSFIDILPDHYKRKHISLYHPRKAPLLNQYRLIVPRTRNFLDLGQFILLLTLYLLVMKHHKHSYLTPVEVAFAIYACGWVLDEFASMLEHGWQVYTQNLWSFLDFMFALIFILYLVVRVHDLSAGITGTQHRGLDILATGAPVLIPRLAFNLMSEHILFVSLRAMMSNFTLLTFLAVWTFAGFLLGMVWLTNGEHHPVTIAKWMLYVWFGLDGTGIQQSLTLHWLLGPILMVTFTILGNTLFLTIVVAMLSNTFATIVANSTAEVSFRRAVLTFEGVKSDAIFSYQPPFNLLALLLMWPLKLVASPRWFHKLNVTFVRIINAPLLLVIAWYERHYLWKASHSVHGSIVRPRNKLASWGFTKLSVHGGIQACFEIEPPQATVDAIDRMVDRGTDKPEETIRLGSQQQQEGRQSRSSAKDQKRIRTESTASANGFPEHLSALLHDDKEGSAKQRLKALEESNQRIERMLQSLCGDASSNNDEI
ncbi:MAG: hypothetical protein LQ350_004958 [Teloschistes chrysophthalmus]|nr:MAG: hypothetical protein LQ350_004958 [Niorma chrysophthalma]